MHATLNKHQGAEEKLMTSCIPILILCTLDCGNDIHHSVDPCESYHCQVGRINHYPKHQKILVDTNENALVIELSFPPTVFNVYVYIQKENNGSCMRCSRVVHSVLTPQIGVQSNL